MLAGLLVAFGFAWLQPGEGARSVDVDVVAAPDIEEASADEAATEDAETAERPATPADRVVDEAGFPSIAEAEPIAQEEDPGPVVTINGRPIRDRSATQSTAASDDASEETAPRPSPTQDTAVAQTESAGSGSEEDADTAPVAVLEPPLPLPRPEGLQGQRTTASVAPEPQRGAVDYDAIAAAAYGGDDSAFMTPEERRELAPMPGVANFEPEESFDPRSQGLVEIVDASGERIWVYEDQIRDTDSRVTVNNQRRAEEFGFVYENEGPVW